MLYKEEVDFQSESKLVDKLSVELRKLMIICQENLHHTLKLQKRAHDKDVKPWSYASNNKIWLNSKYIKTNKTGS